MSHDHYPHHNQYHKRTVIDYPCNSSSYQLKHVVHAGEVQLGYSDFKVIL